MVTTLTLNPAVDKTFFVQDFQVNALNRAHKIKYNAGSKGVNISRIMKVLSVDTVTTGFSGGHGGQILEQELIRENVPYDFVQTEAPVRINTKVSDVISGTFTDINEPGGEITEDELSLLFEKIGTLAARSTIFTMGGSVQSNLPADIYRTILEQLRPFHILTGLDCGGEYLRYGIEAKPDFIKPNELELSLYAGKTLATLDEIVAHAAAIHQKNIPYVLVSLGENGSVCVCGDGAYRVEPVSVKALGTAGAGDSFFSGFLYGILQKWEVADCLKAAASFGAAKVMEEGTDIPAKEKLFAFMDNVVVRRI